jgi:RNA polymerase sigma-70 factor (ECF subfamily)
MNLLTNEQLALFNGRDRRNRQIFDLVFRIYYGRIVQYLYRILNNKPEAEDIAMQVFLELLKSTASFETEENIKAWLFRRARNRCLDFLELQEERKVMTKALIRQFKEEENNNAQLQNNMQATDALIDFINQLPRMQRKITSLYFFKDLTRAEIADELNTSLNNVTKQLNISIEKIKNRFGNA